MGLDRSSNVPWEQGQITITEVLQLMRQGKWSFPADLELECNISEGPTAMAAMTAGIPTSQP